MGTRLRTALSPRRLVRRLWPPLLFLVLIVLVWKLALAADWVSESILPQPEDIAVSFWELTRSDFVWDDAAATLRHVPWLTLAGLMAWIPAAPAQDADQHGDPAAQLAGRLLILVGRRRLGDRDLPVVLALRPGQLAAPSSSSAFCAPGCSGTGSVWRAFSSVIPSAAKVVR